VVLVVADLFFESYLRQKRANFLNDNSRFYIGTFRIAATENNRSTAAEPKSVTPAASADDSMKYRRLLLFVMSFV
jgi:hypothetical protein